MKPGHLEEECLSPQLERSQAIFGLQSCRGGGEPALSRNGGLEERKGKDRLVIVFPHTCRTPILWRISWHLSWDQ